MWAVFRYRAYLWREARKGWHQIEIMPALDRWTRFSPGWSLFLSQCQFLPAVVAIKYPVLSGLAKFVRHKWGMPRQPKKKETTK